MQYKQVASEVVKSKMYFILKSQLIIQFLNDLSMQYPFQRLLLHFSIEFKPLKTYKIISLLFSKPSFHPRKGFLKINLRLLRCKSCKRPDINHINHETLYKSVFPSWAGVFIGSSEFERFQFYNVFDIEITGIVKEKLIKTMLNVFIVPVTDVRRK